MKKKNRNVYDPLPEQGYKKRYLVRKEEEREAKQQVREFDPFDEPNEHDYLDREET